MGDSSGLRTGTVPLLFTGLLRWRPRGWFTILVGSWHEHDFPSPPCSRASRWSATSIGQRQSTRPRRCGSSPHGAAGAAPLRSPRADRGLVSDAQNLDPVAKRLTGGTRRAREPSDQPSPATTETTARAHGSCEPCRQRVVGARVEAPATAVGRDRVPFRDAPRSRGAPPCQPIPSAPPSTPSPRVQLAHPREEVLVAVDDRAKPPRRLDRGLVPRAERASRTCRSRPLQQLGLQQSPACPPRRAGRRVAEVHRACGAASGTRRVSRKVLRPRRSASSGRPRPHVLRHADALGVGAVHRRRPDSIALLDLWRGAPSASTMPTSASAGREQRLRAAHVRAGPDLRGLERHARRPEP